MTIIWCLRHGERLDYEDPSWSRTAVAPDDSPLGKRGHVQAFEAARYLKEERIDHIFSSPFQRCLQTANYVAEAVGLQIKVEAGICEVLNTYPPGYKRIDELMHQFPRIDQTYSSFVVPDKVEHTDSECFGRVGETVKSILENFVTSSDVSILLVGHGASIAGVTKYLLNRAHYVGLCTVTKIVKTCSSGMSWWPETISNSSHLSDRSNLRAY